MKSLLLSVCLVLVSMISLSEEAVEVQQASPEQLQQWFDNGYGAFKKQRYHSAINSLHKFVFQADSDTLNTDWGGLFLALSLEKQGLSHAAVVQFNELLKHQATPQIVNAALLRLEAISRSSAFDNDLLINQTVLAQDFEFIDEGLQDFVSYQQGRYNWAHGFTIWGDEQFSSLTIDGYYFQKHQLLIAQQAVFKGDIRTAISVLDILINKPSVDANNLSEAQLMLGKSVV